MGENLKVAIVGFGKMGLVHAGILNVLPDVEIVGLCEKSSLIRRFSKKLFKKLDVVDDVKKLENLNLDAVYVTTPIPSHFPVVKTILENKISSNIFVEKTLAQTYQEAQRLADLAKTGQSVTMVGYLRRFCVTFNKARELLQQDAIGEVESFKAYGYSSDFVGLEKQANVASCRGGVLRDLGCHVIDLALWFFDDLKVVSAKNSDQDLDSVCFNVEGSRIAGEFDVSWQKRECRMPEIGLTMAGSKGKLFVNDDQVKLEPSEGSLSNWYRQDLNDNVPFWLGLPEYYREDLHFVKAVDRKLKAEPDFCSAAKVDRIISDVVGEEVGHE